MQNVHKVGLEKDGVGLRVCVHKRYEGIVRASVSIQSQCNSAFFPKHADEHLNKCLANISLWYMDLI